jgi:hypothetical protein
VGHSRHCRHLGISDLPLERTFGQSWVYEYTPLDWDDDEDDIPDPDVVFMSKGERAEQARMGEWYKDKTHWSSIVAEQAQRIQEKTEKLRALRLQKEAEQGKGYGVYSLTSRSEVRFRG